MWSRPPADLDFQPAPAKSSQERDRLATASFDGRRRSASRSSRGQNGVVFFSIRTSCRNPRSQEQGFPAIACWPILADGLASPQPIACGVTMMSSSKPDGRLDEACRRQHCRVWTDVPCGLNPSRKRASRLVADDQQTFRTTLCRSGIGRRARKGKRVLVLDGLAAGTRAVGGRPYRRVRLAIGVPTSFRGFVSYAPTDFVGDE